MWRTVHSTLAAENVIHAFYLVTSCIGSSALKMKDNSLIDELQTVFNIVLGRLGDEKDPLDTKTLMKTAKVFQLLNFSEGLISMSKTLC